ncbi:MAG: serine hydrolase [Pseudomonadota bacterium]
MTWRRRDVVLSGAAWGATCSGLALMPRAALAADIDSAPELRTDGWHVGRPSQAGFDPEALSTLIDRIETGEIPNVHAVLVEHDGRLVFERYFSGADENWGRSLGVIDHGPETLHDLRSVTKSVTSALLGIALGIALGGEQQTAVDRSIARFFPNLSDADRARLAPVTLHHVLSMTAGLDWNEMVVPYTDPSNDEIRLYQTDDPVGMVLARPVIQTPGSSWYYNGGLTQVVAGVIERLTGQRIDEFAEEVLFGPLGIFDYTWHRASAWPATVSPSAASGLRLRARDLAKIASVVLSGGAWWGQQVIPPAWIAASTKRHVQDVPWGPPGAYGYGYFWYPGRLADLGGLHVIRAVGNGDQRLFIAPDERIAVTVFAGNYNDFRHFSGDRIFAAFMHARR